VVIGTLTCALSSQRASLCLLVYKLIARVESVGHMLPCGFVNCSSKLKLNIGSSHVSIPFDIASFSDLVLHWGLLADSDD
jgi:hypothetical protein